MGKEKEKTVIYLESDEEERLGTSLFYLLLYILNIVSCCVNKIGKRNSKLMGRCARPRVYHEPNIRNVC